MKISRNELKQLIEETLSEQQSSIASTTPKKTRAPSGGERAIKLDIEGFVKSVVDDVVGDKSINAMITVGRSAIYVTRVTGDASDMGKEIKRALKDDPDLSVARKDLKRMRAVKITYDKVEGGSSGSIEDSSVVDLPPQDAPKPKADSKAPKASSPKKKCDDALAGHFAIDNPATAGTPPKKVTVSDPKGKGHVLTWNLPGDSSYRYMIGDSRWGTHPPEGVDHGCWYAQNMKTCKVFSLKGNEKANKILNGAFDIVGYECGTDDVPGETPDSPGETVIIPKEGGGNLEDLKNDAIVVLMAYGTSGNPGQQLLAAYNRGDEAGYKEVISQGERLDMSVDKAYKMFITPADHLSLNGSAPQVAYFNAKNAGKSPGEILDAVFKVGADFDVPGVDSSYDKNLFSDLRKSINKKYGSNLGALKESRESKKMKFGKSRGTLLREKYWGRY